MNKDSNQEYNERKKAMVGDFEYFIANFKPLYLKYRNKYIAIKNKEILGSYDTFEKALTETAKTEKIGTFIIQQCTNNVENNTAVFNSNVLN